MTAIEWAHQTLNDQGGCTKVSEACQHCYALRLSRWLGSMSKVPWYQGVTNGDRWTHRINTDIDRRRDHFGKIRASRKPQRTFYGSMTDLFHEALEIDGEALSVLAECAESLRNGCKVDQVVMLLTKRPERLLEWQKHHFPNGLPPQIWVGCTVENQKRADERIPVLVQVDAAVRYLSCEPVFGSIRLCPPVGHKDAWINNLEWIIAGGESGTNARLAEPLWMQELRDQSVQANIPFHFKQWGEWDANKVRVGKKQAGRELDGKTWDEFPPWTPGVK